MVTVEDELEKLDPEERLGIYAATFGSTFPDGADLEAAYEGHLEAMRQAYDHEVGNILWGVGPL